jgi:hypothetical protein
MTYKERFMTGGATQQQTQTESEEMEGEKITIADLFKSK